MPFTIRQFSFHQVPITAGWAEAVWNEKILGLIPPSFTLPPEHYPPAFYPPQDIYPLGPLPPHAIHPLENHPPRAFTD